MYFELKENKPHGTKDDPFSTYHIKNEGRSFQIPVHWHDELEIIYVNCKYIRRKLYWNPRGCFCSVAGQSAFHGFTGWRSGLFYFPFST
jgi:hypothetical protein